MARDDTQLRVSTNQALKTIGIDAKLGDFIKGRKEFVLEGAKISMVRDDTTLKPLSVANQLEEILREHGPTMEVTALCSKFIQKFHVSVANVVQMRPMDFIMQEKEKFAMIGASSVTLKEFESQEKAKVEGSSLRMARAKSPQVARPQRQGTPTRSRPVQPPKIEQNDEMYQELQQDLVPELQQPRGAGAEHGQGGCGGEDLPERGRGGEGRVRREGDGHHGLRGRGACVLREGSPDGGPREVAAAAAAFGAEHAAGAHPGGRRDEDRVHGRLGADEGEGHDHGGAPLLPGVRQLREDSSGARRARTVRAEAVRAVLREGADAVRGEAARAREGDDAAAEVVARPAGVVVRSDEAVGLRAGVDRHLRVAAVRQGDAGSDDRELHVPAVPVRPAARGVVELLRSE